jgi:LL-diaminopimelate aminotransferase
MSTQTIFSPAKRISSLQPYYFAALQEQLAQLKRQGVDVIRVDIGSPDLPPADFIIDTLATASRKPDVHGYAPTGGTVAFHQAVATYYGRRFGVELDPMRETLALIGSKEGLFNLSQVLLDPGDWVLVPDPGYPVYSAGAEIAGAQIYSVPLDEQHEFLPDLESIPADVAEHAKLLWLNYPNNPTGAVAGLEFFERAIGFAQQHHLLLAHDAPYVDVCFDGYRAPSLMQVPGAKEVAVEFNSLSKTYNMAGWRLGMVVGNPQVLEYLYNYKSQMDTSQFEPIYEAGVAALTGDQSWIQGRNRIYQERRDIVVDALRAAGFDVPVPKAAIYVWAHVPAAMPDSTRLCDRLLEEAAVSITPGEVYGPHGQGFVRVSLGISTDRLKEAMLRVRQWAADNL